MMSNNLKINYEEAISRSIRRHRQYRIDSRKSLVVCKVWNRGQGLLALFKFYPDKRIVLINSCLFNKSDERNLIKIKKVIGAEDWEDKKVEYGYPDYYFKGFSLNLIDK